VQVSCALHLGCGCGSVALCPCHHGCLAKRLSWAQAASCRLLCSDSVPCMKGRTMRKRSSECTWCDLIQPAWYCPLTQLLLLYCPAAVVLLLLFCELRTAAAAVSGVTRRSSISVTLPSLASPLRRAVRMLAHDCLSAPYTTCCHAQSQQTHSA